jgi:hypothetical protein
MDNYCETLNKIKDGIPAYSSSRIKVLDALYKQYMEVLGAIVEDPAYAIFEVPSDNQTDDIGKLIALSLRSKKLKQQKDSFEKASTLLSDEIEKLKANICK